MSQPSEPLASFGPNEWLVDELYEQYLQDKNSVDKAWWSFFADYEPGAAAANGSSNGQSANGASNGAATQAPKAEAKIEAETEAKTAPKADTKADTKTDASAQPAPSTAPKAEKSRSSRDTSSPSHTLDPKQAELSNARPISRDGGAAAVQAPEVEDKHVPLRGVAARIVTNMEQSLEVPTATSVRAVPAKLLIDNRIVINNHLARSRGGKVSFTHLLGYAIVKALKLVPDMNNALATDDKGKPVLVRPGHVNFGLAIDLAKDDGSRTLVVPNVKNAEAMDFVQFWSAYEEMVRKARTNTLTL